MARSIISIADFFSLESSFATEYRRLLHNIMHSPHKPELKTILVTSSTLSEGKSTCCALLGLTAAKDGLKTLIMDCDLRRPSVHKLFRVERDRGICELLTDGVPVKNVIKKTSVDKLDLITAGKVNSHPAEIFDTPAIARLIEEVKFYYDMILIDSPPIIPVSDPMFLAKHVDGVLLVVKAGQTQREVVSRSVEILSSGNSKILGVVLNNVGNALPYYYDYGYYGYRYDMKPANNKHGRSSRKNHDRRTDDKGESGGSTGPDAGVKRDIAQ